MPNLPDPDLMPEFYARVPLKRFGAWFIDMPLILLLTLLIMPLTAFTGFFYFPLVFGAANLAYRTVALTWWSATPGMMLMAIEFRSMGGQRLEPAQAFLHSLGFVFWTLVPVLQVISAAAMLTTARGQGLSDHLLGTTAINRPAAMA